VDRRVEFNPKIYSFELCFLGFFSIVNTPIKKKIKAKNQVLGMDPQSENFGEKVDFFRRQKGRL
jgi:hypothetical protein